MHKYLVYFDPVTRLTIWTTSPNAVTGYYYHCPQALGFFGPFDNAPAAMKHYNSLIKAQSIASVTPFPQAGGSVIWVDFVARKRI